METPGKRIQKWREYLGKSATDFAEMARIPYSTLKTLETDPKKGKPSFDVLAKLRNACPQLNIDWLFDEGDSEPMLRENRHLTTAATPPPAPAPSPKEEQAPAAATEPQATPADGEAAMSVETNNNPWFHRYQALLDLMKATGSITNSQYGALKKSKGSALAAAPTVEAEPRIFVTGYRRYETVMFINRDSQPNRLAWVDAALNESPATLAMKAIRA